MCVIILRQPNVDIDFEKIKSACIVNPDGWGMVVNDRGKQVVSRHYNPKGNDPEDVARALEEAKNLPVYLHLRYSTAGKKNVDNCHPFLTTMKGDDGISIAFMHNGTVGKFSTTDMCDSYNFNEKIIRPLLKRIMAFSSPEEALADPLLPLILKEYAGSTSVFTLVDQNDKTLVINEDRGKQFDGWWASNSYSFDRTHREPVSQTRGSWYYNYKTNKYESIVDDEEPFEKDDVKPSETKKVVKISNQPKNIPTLEPVETFCEVAKINDLVEVCKLTEDDIDELIYNYPEKAKLLIRDLLFELYNVRISEDSDDNDTTIVEDIRKVS